MKPATKRNEKRKRANNDSADEDEAKSEEALVKSLHGKLHHGLKETKQASKKAKAFEIRRSIKRLKQLKRNAGQSSEVTRVEAELELLKAMDHEPVAHSALSTKLHKDALWRNPVVQRTASDVFVNLDVVLSTKGKSSAIKLDDSARTKVESRISSSKILAATVKAVLDHVRNALEPRKKADASDSDSESDDEGAIEDADSDDDHVPSMNRPTGSGSKAVSKKPLIANSLSGTDDDDDDEEEEADGDESEEPIDDGGDDDGWESGSVHSDAEPTRPSKRIKLDPTFAGANDEDSDATSDEGVAVDEDGDDDGDDDDDDDESEEAGPASHFLPSLNVGFTRGDDGGSDWSGAEEDAEAVDGPKRKNRRGQRARKAIWEKKYGKNANHVKKLQEEERAINEARALATRASRGGRGRGRGGSALGTGIPKHLDGGWKGGAENVKARAPPPPAAPMKGKAGGGGGKGGVQDSGPLHPSWEAKRKMKEREKVSIVPGQGKKIKF